MLWWKFFDNNDAEKILQHQAAVGRNWPTVAVLKAEFAKDEPDPWAINEAWDEVSFEDKMLLWLAPTKGGVFTTKERKQFAECMEIVRQQIRGNHEA